MGQRDGVGVCTRQIRCLNIPPLLGDWSVSECDGVGLYTREIWRVTHMGSVTYKGKIQGKSETEV